MSDDLIEFRKEWRNECLRGAYNNHFSNKGNYIPLKLDLEIDYDLEVYLATIYLIEEGYLINNTAKANVNVLQVKITSKGINYVEDIIGLESEYDIDIDSEAGIKKVTKKNLLKEP